MESVSIRLELGIAAQKMTQMVSIHSQEMEKMIERGITEALDELMKDDLVFLQMVKDEVKRHIGATIKYSVTGYDINHKINKAIQEKIGDKLSEYADGIADKVISQLNMG